MEREFDVRVSLVVPRLFVEREEERVLELERLSDEEGSAVRVLLELRDSTVERVGVVLRVSVAPRVAAVLRVSVVPPRVSVVLRELVPRVSEVPRVLVPRVSEVPRVLEPRVSVVLRVSVVPREVGVSVAVPPREPPVLRLVLVEVPEVWLLLTGVPVDGLWSRVCSGVFTMGRSLPGVQVEVGMGAGALGWRM